LAARKPSVIDDDEVLMPLTVTSVIAAGGGALKYTFVGEVNLIAGANDTGCTGPLEVVSL